MGLLFEVKVIPAPGIPEVEVYVVEGDGLAAAKLVLAQSGDPFTTAMNNQRDDVLRELDLSSAIPSPDFKLVDGIEGLRGALRDILSVPGEVEPTRDLLVEAMMTRVRHYLDEMPGQYL